VPPEQYGVASVLLIGRATAADSLENVLDIFDFVSLHVPRSPATVNMIAVAPLARMMKSAKLIYASRGTVVDATSSPSSRAALAVRPSRSSPASPQRTERASSPRSTDSGMSSSPRTLAGPRQRPRSTLAANTPQPPGQRSMPAEYARQL
jgi:hypothetical protein